MTSFMEFMLCLKMDGRHGPWARRDAISYPPKPARPLRRRYGVVLGEFIGSLNLMGFLCLSLNCVMTVSEFEIPISAHSQNLFNPNLNS